MSKQRFFLVSLALAVIAVGLQFTAMGQFSRSVGRTARAVTAPEQERAALKAEASRYLNRGTAIGYIGLAFALASVGYVIASARKHEPAWRSLTFAMLIFYVLLQFVLV